MLYACEFNLEGLQSGQMQQTVNLSGLALRWFESSSLHHSYAIHTPIGQLVAVCDANTLFYLQFTDSIHPSVFNTITFSNDCPPVLETLRHELDHYFLKKSTSFRVPLHINQGSDFYVHVWKNLISIPFGSTATYSDQAAAMNKPRAVRAVGTAIGKNPFVILIPCHRVIRRDQTLGGYSAGLDRKKWLLQHESSSTFDEKQAHDTQ